MRLLIHGGLKLNHVSKRGPMCLFQVYPTTPRSIIRSIRASRRLWYWSSSPWSISMTKILQHSSLSKFVVKLVCVIIRPLQMIDRISKMVYSIVHLLLLFLLFAVPDSKVHGANMAGRTQVGPMLAPWTLLSGALLISLQIFCHYDWSLDEGEFLW